VLEALTAGDTIRPKTLTKLYQQRTDLVDGGTIRDRTSILTGRPEFVRAGSRGWEYRPERGDADR